MKPISNRTADLVIDAIRVCFTLLIVFVVSVPGILVVVWLCILVERYLPTGKYVFGSTYAIVGWWIVITYIVATGMWKIRLHLRDWSPSSLLSTEYGNGGSTSSGRGLSFARRR